jgi:hypothetical protein
LSPRYRWCSKRVGLSTIETLVLMSPGGAALAG